MSRFHLLGRCPQLTTQRKPANALTPTGHSYLARIAILMTILLAIFSCDNAGDVPGDGSGLSPTDGIITTDTTPTFSWNAVDGAAK